MIFSAAPVALLLAGVLLFSARAADAPFDSARLSQIDSAIAECIATIGTPGAVFWLEHGSQQYHRAYGNRALIPEREPMTEDTIFDAASLTKVLATTPAVMLLVQSGKIDLNATVSSYIPAFSSQGKDAITVRQLLTHTSGLRPDLDPSPAWSGYDKAIALVCDEKLASPPGTTFCYSDINFELLGEIVRRVSGHGLDQFTAEEIYRPLKMTHTGFLPPASERGRIAPTEQVDGEMLRGVVHDPTARRMGGVAGHAGLFTTAADVARFARMLLNGGELDGVRLFWPETIKQMTCVQTPNSIPARRGLGWDIDSGYSRPRGQLFPLGSYGHTGFTGTCLWIDPFSQTFWILLSNRVHPDGRGNILPLQGRLGTLAAEALVGFDFTNVPGALPPRGSTDVAGRKPSTAESWPDIRNGIDVLVAQDFAPLQGLNVGLITNHTGTDRNRRPTIDLLWCAPGVTLKALFSPEHGIRGALDQRVPDSVDQETGLPVYSLYGERHAPTPEQLQGLDALVFDIQDIGCRFYTYISTLGLCLEAADQAQLKFFVLDRVNPINGLEVDGSIWKEDTSFIAFHTLPVRHGMTVGELARMFNAERHCQTDLTVIPLQGWRRGLWFDETGLPWTNPSPNMRSLTEAMLYPGVGLLEMANLSVGRGTGTPFEVVGAPYIQDVQLAAELNQMRVPGVRFIPVQFTPNASVFKDTPCRGVSILLTDRERCRVVDIGLAIAQTLHRLYPQFQFEKFNRLLGDPDTLRAVRDGERLPNIRASWASDLEAFRARRAKYLIYD
jgi:uncharacterized protein YbbC (DUF1343 family)/CubicO group peptidase (beta-lactamase class C family)